jgi:DNA-binding CsgD family transcriptional regulator/tetratricopeptide (TPR) repeat protein
MGGTANGTAVSTPHGSADGVLWLRPRSYAGAVPLVERGEQIADLTTLQRESLTDGGRLALVFGEAGAGKSALLREWAATVTPGATVLWGACDPLSSPRPLGPLADIAPMLDSRLTNLIRTGEREGLFEVVLDALRSDQALVVVVEDLHWADESTLDLVRFLARRITTTSALLVVTYRDEQLPPADPVRVMLGDVVSQQGVRRIEVPLLSPGAVSQLAAGTGVDPAALYRETGGNAFFVTEVLAAGGDVLPTTVQDAVQARVQRLAPRARVVLESATVIGARVEPALLLSMSDVDVAAVDECVASGMLRWDGRAYVFRHELVRQSVLAGIAPGRLGALHWQALDRLRAMPMQPRPYARLAQHAEMAGDPAAVLEFAVAAGDEAAALSSHREAASQYIRAAAYAELLDPEDRLVLHRKCAEECFINDDQALAMDYWQRVIVALRAQDRPHELSHALVRYGRCMTTVGDHVHVREPVAEAIAVVADLPPSRELAMAKAFNAQACMANDPVDAYVAEAADAVRIARAVGDPAVLAHVLNTYGSMLVDTGDPTSVDLLQESLDIAWAHALESEIDRGYNNLSYILWTLRRFEESVEAANQGLKFATDHDLNGSVLCLLAAKCSVVFEIGRWDEAEAIAHDLLDVRGTKRASRMEAVLVLAVLAAARQGDLVEALRLVDEAQAHIDEAQILMYDGAVAIVRAEIELLRGDPDAVVAAVGPWYEVAVRAEHRHYISQLGLLLWRAGRLDALPDAALPGALLSLAGRPAEAAAAWAAEGLRYPAAWALLDSDVEADVLAARALFDELGATALVARADDRLRALGAKVPRGPRPSTRSNIAGLTDREVEVLDLLRDGLRNAEIAAALQLSDRTVGHHVSAILAKLGASSRLEAVRRARDLADVG